MRIGFTTSNLSQPQAGMGDYIMAMTRALLARDEPPELVLFVLEEDLPLFDFASRRAEVVSVAEEFRPVEKDIEWHRTQLPELARQHRLDVLHVADHRRMPAERSVPLVTTVHDLSPFRADCRYIWQRGFHELAKARRLARRQDVLIATSESTAHEVRKILGLPGHRITVVYNGIDHERFVPGSAYAAKTELASRFDLVAPFFVRVAPLAHPAENHVRLIEAFNRFKSQTKSEWQLVLAGGDGPGAELIHAAIQQSPYAEDLRAIGGVDVADLPLIYQAADAFVFPSLLGEFDLAPIEAMACGCPVISSLRGSLAEVVGDSSSLIDPGEVDDIAEKLAAMAGNLDLRQRWREAGLTQAGKFDWRRTAEETLAVCERVVPPR